MQDYVKPTFYLELNLEKENIVPGQPLKATVRARRYAGGVPEGALRGGPVPLAAGRAAWGMTRARAGARGDVRHGLHHRGLACRSGSTPPWSSAARRRPWESATKFDENEAVIEINVPPLAAGEERLPYRYSLTVRARDDQSTFANASASFFLSDVEVFGAGSFSEPVAKKGAEATLAVRATTLSGKPYGVTQAEVEFVLRGGRQREEPGQALLTTARTASPREGAHQRRGHGAGAHDGEGQERQGVDGRAVHARHRRP